MLNLELLSFGPHGVSLRLCHRGDGRSPSALAFPNVLATAVGYSRVHTGVHYPSDVMSGAILGLTVGTPSAGPPSDSKRTCVVWKPL